MLASSNPYVRPTVRIPAEAWGIYREGYYAGVCAALRNLHSARESFTSLEKARRRAAVDKRNAERSAKLVCHHVREQIGVSVDHLLETTSQGPSRGEWKHEVHDTIIVGDTHCNVQHSGLGVDDEVAFYVNERGTNCHAAKYQLDLFDTQLEISKQIP